MPAAIELKEVSKDNFWDLVKLKPAPAQKYFVWDNLFLIALSKVSPECVPYGVYDGDVPVGLVMFGLDYEGDSYWIYNIMIDASKQRRGYGKAAFSEMLRIIKEDKKRHKIHLAVNRKDAAAIKLYSSFGFQFTGINYGVFPGTNQIDKEFWATQEIVEEEVMSLEY